jgi:hypothetical protein
MAFVRSFANESPAYPTVTREQCENNILGAANPSDTLLTSIENAVTNISAIKTSAAEILLKIKTRKPDKTQLLHSIAQFCLIFPNRQYFPDFLKIKNDDLVNETTKKQAQADKQFFAIETRLDKLCYSLSPSNSEKGNKKHRNRKGFQGNGEYRDFKNNLVTAHKLWIKHEARLNQLVPVYKSIATPFRTAKAYCQKSFPDLIGIMSKPNGEASQK